MAVITPTTQTSTLDPFKGTLFEYSNADSRIYMSRSINSLLSVYGNDVVTDGFTVSSYSFAANTLNATFAAGSAIIDQTLVETPSPVSVSYNTAGLSLANASVVCAIRFQYLQQFAGNQFSIKTMFVDAANASLAADVFDLNADRLVLAVFDFDATGTIVTQRQSNTYDSAQFRARANTVLIDGTTKQIYPISIVADTVATVVREALY